MGLCVALVVAAGKGRRFGGDLPKQYRMLAGKPVLRWSLEALASHPRIDAVCAVIAAEDGDLFAAASHGVALLPAVQGGAERQESVYNGLKALAESSLGEIDRVLIHDGARPFPARETLDALIDALDGADGAIPGLAVTDTLKRVEAAAIAATVPRDGLFRAQTPQAFRFAKILAAHDAAAGQRLTDDSAIAEAAGLRVVVVPGRDDNLKITSPEDLQRAEEILSDPSGRVEIGRMIRVGSGFDVHRFGPGRSVWICGLEIPHGQGLLGHSDADVGLHALVDAILGALGAGDIGEHFPPSDPRWRGAPSHLFLSHACDLVQAAKGRIEHLDVTVICEAPRLKPHKQAMREKIAEIAALPLASVSVKATTTESLGFTGRREGIAAQAVATLSLPGVRPS